MPNFLMSAEITTLGSGGGQGTGVTVRDACAPGDVFGSQWAQEAGGADSSRFALYILHTYGGFRGGYGTF